MNMLHTFSRGLVVTAIVLVVNVGAVDLTTIKGTVRNAPYGQFVLVSAANKTFDLNFPGSAATAAGVRAVSQYAKSDKDCTKIAKDAGIYFLVNGAVRKGFDIATLNNNYDAKTVIANTYDSIMPEGMVKDAVKDLTKELLPVAQEFVYAYITEIIIESVKNAVNKKG